MKEIRITVGEQLLSWMNQEEERLNLLDRELKEMKKRTLPIRIEFEERSRTFNRLKSIVCVADSADCASSPATEHLTRPVSHCAFENCRCPYDPRSVSRRS